MLKRMLPKWIVDLFTFKDKDELLDNEYGIMNLLFNNSKSKLTTQQSLQLIDRINTSFDDKMGKRLVEIQLQIDNLYQEKQLIINYGNQKKKDFQTNSTAGN